MDIDDIFHQATARGLPIPVWKWPPLKAYNGFTHDQRVKVWQAVKLAIEMGLMPPPSTGTCEICRTRQNLCYHSEDYSVLAPYILCQRCHRLIHQRFKTPEAWQAHVARYHQDGAWFTALPLTR
ncbi:MAG: hypothetical protein WAZ18_01670 [Alphaproteobacteria bacterium]